MAHSITALSSTKAELIAAVTAAKNIKYVRSVMEELGVENTNPTPIYKDNQSTTEIIKTKNIGYTLQSFLSKTLDKTKTFTTSSRQFFEP